MSEVPLESACSVGPRPLRSALNLQLHPHPQRPVPVQPPAPSRHLWGRLTCWSSSGRCECGWVFTSIVILRKVLHPVSSQVTDGGRTCLPRPLLPEGLRWDSRLLSLAESTVKSAACFRSASAICRMSLLSARSTFDVRRSLAIAGLTVPISRSTYARFPDARAYRM